MRHIQSSITPIVTDSTKGITGQAASESVLGSNSALASANNWLSTGLAINLPTSGTYLVGCFARLQYPSTGSATLISGEFKLYNATDAADVSNSIAAAPHVATIGYEEFTVPLSSIVTVGAGKTIALYVRASVTGFTVVSNNAGYSKLYYVRIA